MKENTNKYSLGERVIVDLDGIETDTKPIGIITECYYRHHGTSLEKIKYKVNFIYKLFKNPLVTSVPYLIVDEDKLSKEE